MERAYASVPGPAGDWQIHYRRHGEGPPLVMLHPSPLCGAFLAAQMRRLAPRACCIAWDTPGYGASDPLPKSWNTQTLEPYVKALASFIDALDFQKVALYGSATGAQIAIEFARIHSSRCRALLLENLALFSDEEVEAITRDYFPDLSPSADGEHLGLIWDMARRGTRCFPWQADDCEAQRRDAYPPPAVINDIARAYLAAGPDYARAYRAAFANERLEPLAAVPVPTRIVLWDEGLLGKYGERIAQAPLPEPMQIVRAGPGFEARMTALDQAAHALLHATRRESA